MCFSNWNMEVESLFSIDSASMIETSYFESLFDDVTKFDVSSCVCGCKNMNTIKMINRVMKQSFVYLIYK